MNLERLYPIITDGDRMYLSDIDFDNSDFTDWEGNPEDLFKSPFSPSIVNSTTDNPKQLIIALKQTGNAIQIGFGENNGGNFSNIKISLLGSGGATRSIFDNSTDDTDRTSLNAQFENELFNSLLIEFYTPDTVSLSNLTIQKSSYNTSQIQGMTPDGTFKIVNSTQDGYLATVDNSSGLSIAKGDVTGVSFVHKFGNAPDFDETDGVITIWDGANDAGINRMTYIYSSSAIIDSISSNNASDTVDIEIQGLDSNYDVVTQTATLQGQTRVPLTTNLIRVFRLKNIGNTSLAGNVFVYENTALSSGTPTDTSKIRASILNGNNQTLMAVYTIPNGYTGYMRDWYASTSGSNKDSNYVIDIYARPFNQVFQLKHKSAISDVGTSYIKHNYFEPEIFQEKTDIEIKAKATGAGVVNASLSAGFDIVLISNT